MLQIKLKNKTPANRLATRLSFFDHEFKKLSIIKKICHITTKKTFKKFVNKTVNIKYYNTLIHIVCNYFYNKAPYSLIITTKTIYNQEYNWPGLLLLLPGKACYIYTSEIFQKLPDKLLGSCFSLFHIPFNFEVCYLSNHPKTRWSYIKSSGTYGIKLKTKKHIKLILVKLPSQLEIFFQTTTLCFIGSNFNFFLNKQVEGKWGFSFKKTKTKNVRGVAKNPVDHPNGGRTKAKQPEKTPWGWIAKNNK